MSASGGPLWRGVFQAELSMRSHVSWRASGAAARAYTPCDRADLAAFLSCLRADEPLLVVGLGSNLLIRDGGYSGTVIFLHGVLRELRVEGDCCFAEAGVASPKLARFAANNVFVEAEFLAGIPGTVGGALAMNAGCYGGETWRYVERALMMMAGVHGFLAVALGAFGAHGLRASLAELEDGARRLEWWSTAAQYHLVHALAIGVVFLR